MTTPQHTVRNLPAVIFSTADLADHYRTVRLRLRGRAEPPRIKPDHALPPAPVRARPSFAAIAPLATPSPRHAAPTLEGRTLDAIETFERLAADRPFMSRAVLARSAAAYAWCVSADDLCSPSRRAVIVEPRQVAMAVAHHFAARSLPEIGRRFGDRDHTTVLHAVAKYGPLVKGLLLWRAHFQKPPLALLPAPTPATQGVTTMTTPQTKPQIIRVPLKNLSIDAKNVRKAGRGEAEPVFVSSIECKGVIEPLIVRRSLNVGYTITNGGKRFAALQHMAKKGLKAKGVLVTEAYEVDVIVRQDDDGEATETSLITNIVRAPTHPVDKFEAFAEMVNCGDTVEAIAKRYGMKMVEVRQALSLAGIHPEIRQAWRDGKIDAEAAEVYALTKDLEHQLRVFKKLKGNAGNEYQVKQEIVGGYDAPDIGDMLKIVGATEYEAAGHQVNRSLFDDNDNRNVTVDNLPALRAMLAKKIADECERLKKDGWAWAIPADEAPKDIRAWRRLPTSTPTKEQKAAAGCTVGMPSSYTNSGKLQIERGFVKPGANIKLPQSPAAKAATAKAKKTRDETGGVNNSLAHRLSQQITKAAHDALADDHMLALRVAIAAMASTYGSPAQIKIDGMYGLVDDDRDYEFEKYLKLTEGKGQPALLAMLAEWTARSLDMQCHAATQLPLSGKDADDDEDATGAAMLLNRLPATALNAALRKHFDAADYFKNVPAEIVKDAITEMGLKPLASKKAELVEVAVAKQKSCGWLPRELRTKHYDGPVAKATPKTSARKPAKARTAKPKAKAVPKKKAA